MKYRFCILCAVVCCAMLTVAAPYAAAAEQAAKPLADRPIRTADRTTSVAVVHEGSDVVGTRVAFQLKNVFNTSSLFTLAEKDGPKLKVYLSTLAEFPSRPGIASAYSVVWVFSQSEGTLGFLLARDVGLVSPDDVDGLVTKLAERTDGIAARYAYLFTK
jgi:hypothetical protein